MDPANLPLEVFIGIMSHLPPVSTWASRRTASTWAVALSSSYAVSTALQGEDFDTFKRGYTRRPSSCHIFTNEPEHIENAIFASNGTHVAYLMYDWSRPISSSVKYDLTLHIHPVHGGQHVIEFKTKQKPQTRLLMDDSIVAFVTDDRLYLSSLQGEWIIRPLPGKYRGGMVKLSHGKVAVLAKEQSHQLGPLEANNLWTYDHASDKWSRKTTLEVKQHACWQQNLLIDAETVHILSVGNSIPPHARMRPNEHPYVVHCQAGRKHWTHLYGAHSRYMAHYPSWSIEAYKSGDSFDITVNTQEGWHAIRADADSVVPKAHSPVIAANNAVWTTVEGGFECQAGFLWIDTVFWRTVWPTILTETQECLVAFSITTPRRFIHICVVHFDGPRRTLEPSLVWERAEPDRQAQLDRREDLVRMDPIPQFPRMSTPDWLSMISPSYA